MNDILKNFLTNQIVVDWIAPIVTGLILLMIPTKVINFFRARKDVEKISLANKRFVNSIRPYIIQKINIESNFISDIRRVIINESSIKGKYVYTEIDLRNKLILDITEDNYINEKDKKELIDFSYKIFSKFNMKEIKNDSLESQKQTKFALLDKVILLLIFITSLAVCAIIQVNSPDANLEDNLAFSISYVSAFFSFLVLFVHFYKNIFKSNNRAKKTFQKKLIDIFAEEISIDTDIQKDKVQKK